MIVESLSQIKNVFHEGRVLQILMSPTECMVGKKLQVNIVCPEGIYLTVPGDKRGFISRDNDGKGTWFSFGDVADWEVNNNVFFRYDGEHTVENFIMAFQVITENASDMEEQIAY